MPQLDTLNWFNQVVTSSVLSLLFYYLLFLNYIPFFMGLLKSRAKIQALRLLISTIFSTQAFWYIQETVLSLQSMVASSLMIIWLYNTHNEENMIKNWLFQETTLWSDLEELLVNKEQIQIL
jgi:hypothetical protein